MATFLEMQNSVYRVLRDSAKQFITLETVKEWLNEAQLDLAARLRDLFEYVTSTTDGTNEIDVPADFIEVYELILDTDTVRWVDFDTWNRWSEVGSTPPVPVCTLVADGGTWSIRTYPTPASGTTYYLRYYKKPAELTADAAVSELPEELHVRMINYARAMACYAAENEGMGDRYMAMYEANLPPSPTGRGRIVPGPLSVVQDPGGPWDLDVDSIHV